MGDNQIQSKDGKDSSNSLDQMIHWPEILSKLLTTYVRLNLVYAEMLQCPHLKKKKI